MIVLQLRASPPLNQELLKGRGSALPMGCRMVRGSLMESGLNPSSAFDPLEPWTSYWALCGLVSSLENMNKNTCRWGLLWRLNEKWCRGDIWQRKDFTIITSPLYPLGLTVFLDQSWGHGNVGCLTWKVKTRIHTCNENCSDCWKMKWKIVNSKYKDAHTLRSKNLSPGKMSHQNLKAACTKMFFAALSISAERNNISTTRRLPNGQKLNCKVNSGTSL